MSWRISNRRRGSSRRKRATSSRSPASTTTNGSTPSATFCLILGPNWASSAATISAAVMVLGLRRFPELLVPLGEIVGPVGGVQLLRQLDEPRPHGHRHVHRLPAGQVLHAADLVLDAHQAFKERLGP